MYSYFFVFLRAHMRQQVGKVATRLGEERLFLVSSFFSSPRLALVIERHARTHTSSCSHVAKRIKHTGERQTKRRARSTTVTWIEYRGD